MKYSVTYSSNTGNTKLLADTVKNSLPAEDCVYFGAPVEDALSAGRIYVGFWTDEGSSDPLTTDFLKGLRNKEIFLFGSAGYGLDPAYFDQVIANVKKNIDKSVTVIGSFMCQGKMRNSVRERYESMLNDPKVGEQMKMMIKNFDMALTHPDSDDLAGLEKSVKATL